MAPHQVTEKTVPEVCDKLYGHRLDQKTPPPKCQVGDRVRLNKKHRPFKKGFLPRWTEEVFVVTHVRRHLVVTYRLSEWDGTPIKGTFYEPDVQKVQVSDDSIFRVEKVLKRKGRNELVRWKGWLAKYDSWIPPNPDIVRIKQKTPRKKRVRFLDQIQAEASRRQASYSPPNTNEAEIMKFIHKKAAKQRRP